MNQYQTAVFYYFERNFKGIIGLGARPVVVIADLATGALDAVKYFTASRAPDAISLLYSKEI